MSGAFRMSGDGRALLGSAFRRLSLVAAILDAERLAALRSLEQSLIGRALARQRPQPLRTFSESKFSKSEIIIPITAIENV